MHLTGGRLVQKTARETVVSISASSDSSIATSISSLAGGERDAIKRADKRRRERQILKQALRRGESWLPNEPEAKPQRPRLLTSRQTSSTHQGVRMLGRGGIGTEGPETELENATVGRNPTFPRGVRLLGCGPKVSRSEQKESVAGAHAQGPSPPAQNYSYSAPVSKARHSVRRQQLRPCAMYLDGGASLVDPWPRVSWLEIARGVLRCLQTVCLQEILVKPATSSGLRLVQPMAAGKLYRVPTSTNCLPVQAPSGKQVPSRGSTCYFEDPMHDIQIIRVIGSRASAWPNGFVNESISLGTS